ncbi:hypothetical protein ACLGIH_10060 [Streptomyces sp. HMX87]|uniref:hypothetical protein n=1 Tax=Streptomyces sp. HMX87 TaxID=3390849 RepID=UPI003A84C1C9
MPADEVTHGADVESSRVRTGPRHAAPKKPLFTRFHMPAGKAIALAAMPTAVLMGMGFTPTLAVADGNDAAKPTSNSLTADEYKDCVAALEDEGKEDKGEGEDDSSASPAPTPSPSVSESGAGKDADEAGPGPGPSAGKPEQEQEQEQEQGTDTGTSSSPDSGSDDKAGPAPSPSASGGDTASPSPAPSPSESRGNVLEEIGGAIEDIFTGGGKAEESPNPTPTPSASESDAEGAPESAGDKASDPVEGAAGAASEAAGKAGDTADRATGDAGEAAEDVADAADEVGEAAGEAAEQAGDATASASPGPTPSASAGTDLEDCPVATDAEGGVDNTVPLPDDPWYLNASSLLLKGASYEGIVEVRTANGSTKKVLKYVISDGTDIGDLHQTVKDDQSGKTYHVQAAKGSTSTIRGGDTVMYTESISGNLLGLIPVTFDPEHPPPLDIPLIYFTKVKVVQAGQFGGNLHVPGLQQYITD